MLVKLEFQFIWQCFKLRSNLFWTSSSPIYVMPCVLLCTSSSLIVTIIHRT